MEDKVGPWLVFASGCPNAWHRLRHCYRSPSGRGLWLAATMLTLWLWFTGWQKWTGLWSEVCWQGKSAGDDSLEKRAEIHTESDLWTSKLKNVGPGAAPVHLLEQSHGAIWCIFIVCLCLKGDPSTLLSISLKQQTDNTLINNLNKWWEVSFLV